MHHLTSQSADQLSDEFHRLAVENVNAPEAHAAFLHAAKLLHTARMKDFEASKPRIRFRHDSGVPAFGWRNQYALQIIQ